MLLIHLTYHTVKEYKRLLASCDMKRGPGFSTFEFSMSQEVKKGPFAALTIESSKKFYFNVFPETNLVLFTRYQRNFIRERENFGPMRNALDRSY